MCVRTLLSGLCGELQLTREDLGPATYTSGNPCHLDHIGLNWGARAGRHLYDTN